MFFEAVNRCDVRMRDGREHPGLLREACNAIGIGSQKGRQHLQRDVTGERVVVGAIDITHPARSDSLGHDIVAKATAGQVGRCLGSKTSRLGKHRTAGGFVREQRFDITAKSLVALTGRGQKRRALGRRACQGLVKQVGETRGGRLGHREPANPVADAAASQASNGRRAVVLRMADAGEPVRPDQITDLLRAWGSGSAEALEQLAPMVQAELKRLARRHMRGERAGHTLQPTALVNEAFLRLVDLRAVTWQDRAHFFAMASRLMRRVLVDAARARNAEKRGAAARQVSLHSDLLPLAARADDIIAVDSALEQLAAIDPRKARVVDLRVFGGLTVDETAAALDVSAETVMRDWKFARTWLARALSSHS